jgi:opacity protein-like surface antigen
MKKLIVLAGFLAAMTASTAFAQGFGSVEYGNRSGVDGDASSQSVKVTLGKQLNDNVAVDVSSRFAKDDNVTTNTTRLEAGVTGTMPVGNGFSVYTRGAVGENFTSADNWSYYSVEPGVKYAVSNALTVRAGYRYRDAFSSADTDLTRTVRLGADYALNKTYTVGLGYDRQRGDSEFNAIRVNLGVKF